jgi:ABC-type sugar transport system ATPase subunit
VAEPRRQAVHLDEPTVGVDVGTKVEIYKLFAALLKAGAGIVLISSYLPEVYDLSDTLHVFRRGRLAASTSATSRRRRRSCRGDRRLTAAAEAAPRREERDRW